MSENSSMNRRGFLTAAAADASSPSATQVQNSEPMRPNILFILVDDLRWNALGCAGHPFVQTPNIDRLAKEGAQFENAFVATPLCSPSRASFLTGQYPHTHGIVGNHVSFLRNFRKDTELATYAQMLQRAGYETAHLGKWHMNDSSEPRPGWDHWVSFKGQGVYNNGLLNVNGKPEQSQGYITDVLSDKAEEFVRRPHSKPWVLNLWHKAIHDPFRPAERHKTLYANQTIQRTAGASDDLSGKPMLTETARERGASVTRKGDGPRDEMIKNQLRCLVAIDEGLGRILKALEETRQLENTLILFSSDNGYLWGEHGLADKRAAYEESIRVPMIARWPKLIRAGTRPKGMALNIDVAPTLLELAGIRVPDTMHGKSLVPLLRGQERGWRQAALLEYFQEARFPTIAEWQALRTPDSIYIEYPGLSANAVEYYDLKRDAAQLKNLAGESSAAANIAARKADLRRLLKETRYAATVDEIKPIPTRAQSIDARKDLAPNAQRKASEGEKP